MPLHIHLDAIGGVAGDMFIAAVLDAFPNLRDGMLQAIRVGGLPDDITCRVAEHRDHALTGLRFLVEEPAYRPHNRGLALPHENHHHTPFREIRDRLQATALDPASARNGFPPDAAGLRFRRRDNSRGAGQ